MQEPCGQRRPRAGPPGQIHLRWPSDSWHLSARTNEQLDVEVSLKDVICRMAGLSAAPSKALKPALPPHPPEGALTIR